MAKFRDVGTNGPDEVVLMAPCCMSGCVSFLSCSLLLLLLLRIELSRPKSDGVDEEEGPFIEFDSGFTADFTGDNNTDDCCCCLLFCVAGLLLLLITVVAVLMRTEES